VHSEVKKAQAGLVGAFIAVLVAVIVGVGVVIPVISDTISNSSVTGMTATILNYLPILLAVVLLVAIAGLIALR
jgi:formate-dependent nitrite reductase membrane component NrfD